MDNILLFIPLTRLERVLPLREQIDRLIYRERIKKILIIIDSELTQEYVEKVFSEATVIKTKNRSVHEHNVNYRRLRITDVFKLAQKNIPEGIEYIFCLEDDSLIGEDTLLNLINGYKLYKWQGVNIGLFSGIQVGRWGIKMVGGWLADDVNDPKCLETIPYKQELNVEEVDASGFYCFITEARLFREANFCYNEFGPDINFGLELRRKGYRNFIDRSIIAGHVAYPGVLVPDNDCKVVKYLKINNEWKLNQ